MANRNFRSLLGGAGFYTVLAVCIVAVGVGGYFLLFDQPPQEEEPQTDVVAPVTNVPQDQTPSAQESDDEEAEEEEASAPVSMPEEPVVDDTPVVAEAPHLVVSPLQGEVLAAFSVDELTYNETLADWRTHDGIDIAAAEGTTVLAASAGTVASVTDDALMGTTVVLSHSGGYETTYANLQAKPPVAEGDSVSAGQIIGAVGTTAAAEASQPPHLHFSVTKDGEPIDPSYFLSH